MSTKTMQLVGNIPKTAEDIGAVSYDAAQTLTDEQKIQARDNIGSKAATDSDVFIAEYGVTTSAEIHAAIVDGKAVFCKRDNSYSPLCTEINATTHTFINAVERLIVFRCSSDVWEQNSMAYLPADHASTHETSGTDPITPDMIGAAAEENGQYVVTTAGTGAAYTATVPGITSLTAGASFIMVPHTASTSTAPTLNVNGLGAKTIKRRLSSIVTTLQSGYTSSWLASGKPFRVIYDGTYWIADGHNKPVAADLYGTLPIAKGGTEATTAADARANLDAAPAYTYGTEDLVAGTSELATGRLYFVYE